MDMRRYCATARWGRSAMIASSVEGPGHVRVYVRRVGQSSIACVTDAERFKGDYRLFLGAEGQAERLLRPLIDASPA